MCTVNGRFVISMIILISTINRKTRVVYEEKIWLKWKKLDFIIYIKNNI